MLSSNNGVLRAMSRRNQNKRKKERKTTIASIVKVFFFTRRRNGRRFRRLFCELNYSTTITTMPHSINNGPKIINIHTRARARTRDSRQPTTTTTKQWNEANFYGFSFSTDSLFFPFLRSVDRSDGWMEHFAARLRFCLVFTFGWESINARKASQLPYSLLWDTRTVGYLLDF